MGRVAEDTARKIASVGIHPARFLDFGDKARPYRDLPGPFMAEQAPAALNLLLAISGHSTCEFQCLLSGVKRTSQTECPLFGKLCPLTGGKQA